MTSRRKTSQSATDAKPSAKTRVLRTAALFAGIGGIERGLEAAGHETRMFCEVDPAAQAVLRERFPGVDITPDVRELDRLPRGVNMLTGGFPCQDLSQAGATRGMKGKRSSLVSHVFRLLDKSNVPWVLLENVPFMLQLGKGEAMRYVIDELEELGYRWAYRVIDTRAFGIPHRRERVFILASRTHAPERVLLADAGVQPILRSESEADACGFYWTEGTRGLGWAPDGVPTLKGGSGVGIPSPPALWIKRTGEIVTPDIRDAERLHGFNADWTEPAEAVRRPGYRWTLVGNAVTVDVAQWIGTQLREPSRRVTAFINPLPPKSRWPAAAFGSREGGRFEACVEKWPTTQRAYRPVLEFLENPHKPLSARAASGFLGRLTRSTLRSPEEFRTALAVHIEHMERPATTAEQDDGQPDGANSAAS